MFCTPGPNAGFDAVFETLIQLRASALVIAVDFYFTVRREQLAGLALRHGVPAVYQYRDFAAAGGVMSYGASLSRILSSGWPLHRQDP